MIYDHCLARPEDDTWTLHLYTQLSSTCRFIHNEFGPFLTNHYHVFPSASRLHTFIKSLWRKSCLSELRMLAFVYLAEKSGNPDSETSNDCVIIRQCFRWMAQHRCQLLNLDVYIGDWRQPFRQITWDYENDPLSDDLDGPKDVVLADTAGTASLRPVEGVRTLRFIWNEIHDFTHWYYLREMSGVFGSHAASTEESLWRVINGGQFPAWVFSAIKEPPRTTWKCQRLESPNDDANPYIGRQCIEREYYIEKKMIKEELKIQGRKDCRTASLPCDEPVAPPSTHYRKKWGDFIHASLAPIARHYNITDADLFGDLFMEIYEKSRLC